MRWLFMFTLCQMGLFSFADSRIEISACTVCHGTNLQGNQATDAPAIAGMENWYIESQLRSFRAGTRGTHSQDFSGMEMQPQAAILKEETVRPIASFVANLPQQSTPTSLTGNQNEGRTLYRTCVACHGENATGNKALGAPGLSNQNDWYLETQLNNYINGIRSQTLQDRQMRAATGQLTSPESVRDIVAYIKSLKAK